MLRYVDDSLKSDPVIIRAALAEQARWLRLEDKEEVRRSREVGESHELWKMLQLWEKYGCDKKKNEDTRVQLIDGNDYRHVLQESTEDSTFWDRRSPGEGLQCPVIEAKLIQNLVTLKKFSEDHADAEGEAKAKGEQENDGKDKKWLQQINKNMMTLLNSNSSSNSNNSNVNTSMLNLKLNQTPEWYIRPWRDRHLIRDERDETQR